MSEIKPKKDFETLHRILKKYLKKTDENIIQKAALKFGYTGLISPPYATFRRSFYSPKLLTRFINILKEQIKTEEPIKPTATKSVILENYNELLTKYEELID